MNHKVKILAGKPLYPTVNFSVSHSVVSLSEFPPQEYQGKLYQFSQTNSNMR